MQSISRHHSYVFELRTKKNAGSCRLKKLPLMLKDKTTAHKIIKHVIHKYNLQVTFKKNDDDFASYDVTIAASEKVKDEENVLRHVDIFYAQLNTYSHFLRSLDKNSRNGKITLFMNFDEDDDFNIHVTLESHAFQKLNEWDSTKNLSTNIFSGTENTLKPILQYLYPLRDDCVQYEDSTPIVKKDVHGLYNYIKDHHKSQRNQYFETRSKQTCGKTDNVNDNMSCNISEQKFAKVVQPEDVVASCDAVFIVENEDYNSFSSIDLRCKYQHELLIPSLRCYQAQAVHWMVYKETQDCCETNEKDSELHPLWQEIVCEDGEKIYFNTYNGGLSFEKPCPCILPKGGILADEMGLGKTVEVLALILNNPAKEKFKLELARDNSPLKRRRIPDAGNVHPTDENVCSDILCSNNNQCNTSCRKKLEWLAKNLVETFMPEQEVVITKSKSNLIAPKYLFQKDCDWNTQVEKLGSIENFTVDKKMVSHLVDNCAKDEYYLYSVVHELEIDNGRDIDENCEDITECNMENEEEMVKQEMENNKAEVEEGDELSSQYQMHLIQKKKVSVDKLTCLKRIRGEHDYSTSGKDEHGMYNRKCFVCGDLPKNVDNVTKVKCIDCVNIMHRECTGYMDLNVCDYQCPTCAMKVMTNTHCTLIVCPDTLVTQWVDEVQKHLKIETIKLMVYRGVKNHQFLQPKMLAEFDLIITSFGTLRLDFHYFMADQAHRKLRYQKKYAALPCPLLALNFWRLCIDEAQMVEADNTRLAEMALRVSAVHRWCVTGTPIQKTLEDIYGLFLFLSVRPYSCKMWWKRALLDHYEVGDCKPLFELASHVMWRTSKVDVEQQICLPKQTEYLTWLQFSAVEQHFYSKQSSKCAENTEHHLSKDFSYLSDSLKLVDLSKQTLSKLLSPLLYLRQACCHPAVVRNSYLSMEKKCVTMDQLLGKLTSAAKSECEEAHRKLVCALNGLAGIEILQKNYAKAVEIYKSVIASWEEYTHLTTDSLQKLHTFHNLHDVLSEHSLLEDSEININEVKQNAETLRSKYLSDISVSVQVNTNLLQEINGDVSECKNKIELKNPWWLNLIVFAIEHGLKDDLWHRLNDEISAVNGLAGVALRGKFKTLRGLQMVFNQQLEKIEEHRNNVFESLKIISQFPNKTAVLEAAECCLRPVKESDAPRCNYCCVGEVVDNYEKVLFLQQGYKVQESEQPVTNTGFRSETEIDRALKVFVSFARNQGACKEILKQGKEHIKYQELLKKEFKSIRSVYIAYHQRVQALDELDMCTMRLRLPYEFEENVESKSYVVKRHELHSTKLLHESDKIISNNELRNKQGQLLYLQNLAKVQAEHDGFNPELCPICVMQFGAEWAVFQCGHCICCKCVVELQKQSFGYIRSNNAFISCPMCRAVTESKDISFVVTKLKKPEGFDAGVTIKGNHSTKIEAILRRINWIHEQDRRSKILVFSTWMSVLQLLSSSLRENDVLFKILDGNRKQFQVSLSSFKESMDINVLLAPLHSGAKGLNIIEATHVILVEPALNPGDELQAVGRVHRIGQTKETYVHRFIVKGTVEERMYCLLKTKNKEQEDASTGLTVGDLTTLFA